MPPKHKQKPSQGFVIDLTSSSPVPSSSDSESGEVEALQAELRTMNDAYVRLQLQTKLKVEELVADLEFSHDQINEQENIIRKLELKISHLNDGHDVKLRHLSDECDELRDEIGLLKQELEYAEGREAAADLMRKHAEEDSQIKTEALEAAELEIEQLKKDLNDCQNDLNEALGDIAQGFSEHVQLENMHQDACTQLTTLYEEKAGKEISLSIKSAKELKARERAARLGEELETVNDKYNHLQETFKDLLKRHKAAASQAQGRDFLEDQLRESIITNSRLHGFIREQLDKISELEEEKANLHKLNEVDIAKREKYQKTIKDDELELKKAFEKEEHEQKRVNVELNKRAKQAQKKADSLASKLKTMEKQYGDEMKEAEQVNNALHDEKLQLQDKLEHTTAQLTKTRSDLETMVNEALERNAALAAKQTALHDQLDNTVAMLAERLDLIEQDKAELLEERDQLQKQLEDANAERQQLLTQLNVAQEDLRHSRSAKKDANRQRELELKEANRLRELELNSYKQEAAGYLREIDRMDRIRIQLWKENSDLENGLSSGRRANGKLKHDNAELGKQIAHLQVQLRLANGRADAWAETLADGLGIKEEERKKLTAGDLNALCLKLHIMSKEKNRLLRRLREFRSKETENARSASRGRTFAEAFEDGGGNVDEAVRESLSRSGSPAGAQLIVAEIEEKAVYADDQDDDDEMEWPESKPLFGRRWSVDVIRWDDRNDIFTKAN